MKSYLSTIHVDEFNNTPMPALSPNSLLVPLRRAIGILAP